MPPWRARPDDARTCARWCPLSASMRRTPAATPLSVKPAMRPMSPVRLTWVPPHSSTDQPMVLPPPLAHRDDAHLVAVFLAEQRARAGCDRRRRPPSAAWSPARSAARRRWRCPRPARSPPPSSAWDARSRSAAGRARPASPSARRGRRAPGAAPRAGDASPNDVCRMALAAGMIDFERERRRRP